MSTKLTVLESLSKVVDQLIPGGGIANTFIAAAGYPVGNSLIETDLIDQAKALIDQAAAKGGEIPVPTDVVVGKAFSADTPAIIKPVSDVSEDDMIFDIGPETAARFARMMQEAGTVVWKARWACLSLTSLEKGRGFWVRRLPRLAPFRSRGVEIRWPP